MCLGTPKDITNLIRAGYTNRLANTLWRAGEKDGIPPLTMIQARKEAHGCTFLTKDGLCELHDKGLKPTEGRLAHHDKLDNDELHYAVARTWESEQ